MPLDLVRRNSQQVDSLTYKLLQNIGNKMLIYNSKLSLLTQRIEAHDVKRSLKKGFVLVQQDSKYITRANKLKKESASLIFYDNKIDAEIK